MGNNIDYTTAIQQSPDITGVTVWQPLPAMSDDVRQNESSPFVNIGLLDVVSDLIFSDDFE